MSRLEELIAELCPDGVEYKKLVDVSYITKGVQFNKANMNETGSYPVINGGINPSGYIENYNQSKNTITISQGGASAGFVNWIDVDFWAGAHCYVVKPKYNVLNRFLFHFIKSKEFKLQECQYGAGIPALGKTTVEDLRIPVPPLEVQREIIRILDNFTFLSAELSAELQARKKQYEYYRNTLLSFDNRVDYYPLSQVTNVFRGEYITKKDTVGGDIPVILGGQEPAYYINESNHDGEVVVIARSGVSAGFVSYWNEPIFITDGFGYEAKRDILMPKYLYYVLKKRQSELYAMKRGAGVPHVSGEMLAKIEIPIPKVEVQKRLVNTLDNFESICNDLGIGLPAEIEARQKQYEYYRDLLLTFAETGTAVATDRQTDRQTDRIVDIKILQYVFGFAPVTLEDISENCDSQRKPVTKEKRNVGKYPYYGASGIVDYVDDYIYDGDYLLISEDGANLIARVTPIAFSISGQTWVNNHAHVLKFKDSYVQRYVEMYLNDMDLSKFISGAAQPKLNQKMLNSIVIMLPEEEKAKRIVKILDRFDFICNSISEGLPAEIEARQKQYEYYRDKLLNFKEKES